VVINKNKLAVALLILGLVIGICVGSGIVRLSQPRLAFDLMMLLTFVSMLIWTIRERHANEKDKRMSELKLKKCYLLFFILYLIALFLGGGSSMRYQDSVLSKMVGFIWSLAPSQTSVWWFISLVVSVILIILGFVAGCILITHFVRKEEDQRRE